MIVIKDESGGTMKDDRPDDFPRMNARPVDGASKEILRRDQAVTLVEVETSEDFVVERS
jgi:hypothetical protein